MFMASPLLTSHLSTQAYIKLQGKSTHMHISRQTGIIKFDSAICTHTHTHIVQGVVMECNNAEHCPTTDD